MRNQQRATVWQEAAAPGLSGSRSVFVALGLVVLMAVPAAGQFSATPVIMELVTGDSAAAGTIRVKNEGEAPIQVRFYAGDFEQDEAGTHRFLPAGEHERSCAPRMQLYPEGATLAAGEEVGVSVRLEPGPTSCWSVVFAETSNRSEGGLSIAQRIAVKIYGSSRVGVRSGEVQGVEVVHQPALLALVDFANTGDRALVVTGEVEIRTAEGAVVATVPVEDFSVLPDRHREVAVPLPTTLEPGRYLAIPILDFGGDFLAAGQALFEVQEP